MAKISFEKALSQLEQIVQEMEGGDLPLEKALARFEEGIALSRICSEKLGEMEKRITQLVEDGDGKALEKPFEPLAPAAEG
jgi:exodeoxyribonuclease VII small subunit